MEIRVGRRQLPIQIDAEDYDRIRYLPLSVTSHGYVSISFYDGKVGGKYKYRRVYLHRYLLSAPNELKVDHINHDKRDNRKGNLRLVTDAQSLCNTRARKHGKSRYKGVFPAGRYNGWIAQVNHKHLGSYKTEREAALAYNEAAKRLQGEFAVLNVIK